MYKIISDLKFLFPKLNILFTETIQKILDKEQQQHFKKDSELDSLIIGLKQKQRPFILAQKYSSFLKKWLYFPYKNEFITQRYKVLLTFYMNNLVCFDNLDKNRPLTLEENIWVQKVSEFEALLEKEKINY